MRRVFITGCAGFIGFHVALALKKQKGLEVLGFDNFNSYYDPSLKRDRAEELKRHGVSVLEAELLDKEKLKSTIKKFQPTHVVHLAAMAGCRHSILHPEEYISNNIDGFLTLLEVMKDTPQIPIVYASSSSVYGKNTKLPFSVSDMTDSPANVYGMTKKANELLAFTYYNLYSMPLVGLRFFTVYGPWGRPDMAAFLFTKSIYEGETIDLFNHGKMRRDFTYVDDIVEGILKSLEIPKGFHLYNLGRHESEPIEKLVALIEKALQKKASIRLLPMPEGEVIETFADISLSEKELGYYPKVSIEEGISKFVAWYRDYYGV